MSEAVLWYGLAALSLIALVAWSVSQGEEYEDERRARIEREEREQARKKHHEQ